MFVSDVKTVRELDRITARESSTLTLMERAGEGVAEAAESLLDGVRKPRVAVVCGKGNNGGDGLDAARRLCRPGRRITCLLLSGKTAYAGDARTCLKRAAKSPVRLVDRLPSFRAFDLVIDAMVGTGFTGRFSGNLRECARAINASGVRVLAVDAPSGVDCDTGEADEDAVCADVTVTIGLPKTGLFFHPARGLVGDLKVKDIGFPAGETERRCNGLTAIDAALAARGLPLRPGDTHKNRCGRVLVVAGSKGLTGAAVLAARSALKSGAGVVTLAVPESLNAIFETKLTEEMTLPLPDAGRGYLNVSNAKAVLKALDGYDALVLGPGLSRNSGALKLARELTLKSPAPVVLDADGINAFAGHASLLKKAASPVLLTPHEGEFLRLTGAAKAGRGPQRIASALKWRKETGCGLVLKGAPTLIAFAPDKVYINTTGNPGMATAGAGDVLSGLIGGLLAQSKDPESAAVSGVYLHGLAGDAAALEMTEYCLTAGDILNGFPAAFKEVTR